MIFNHLTLSESEVKLLVKAADSAYQNQMSLDGWEVITPDLTDSDYGLNLELIVGNIFQADGFSFNDDTYGNANAAVLKSGNDLLLAFRGTELNEFDQAYWFALEQHYDLFEPLFQALDNYIQANPTSRLLVTGHSLGAAMAELYMAKHSGSLYSAVTVASPTASNDPSDTRILNIGYDNDIVYEITSTGFSGGANPNNATTNLHIAVGGEHLIGAPPYNHQMINYIYGTNRVFDSAYYSQMEKDSLVLVDLTDSPFNIADLNEISNVDAFLLGEDNDQDNLQGGRGNDVLEGLGENDTLTGDNYDINWLAGDDTLDGGGGNDVLNGGSDNPFGSPAEDEDVAIFTDDFENYDYSISEDGKTISLSHTRGTQTDGVDTLEKIEFAQFGGNSDPDVSGPPRIIPLPLEDGVAATEFVEVADTTANPNLSDPPTPPNVTLSAPVAMLDGDIDYTLNISPYQPDTKYNIAYIIDTSSSMDLGELQIVKDAYTDLTNYFIDNELAENINFGVVNFSVGATPYFNLSAEQAISVVQSLTPAFGGGTKYNQGLSQGLNFVAQSPLDALSTTNIAYFSTDGKSQTNFFDPNDVSFHQDAQLLRNFVNVQAFGVNEIATEPGAATTGQINYVDSNQGLIIDNFYDLSSELQKSGLAGSVEAVNILVDGEVVEIVTPDLLTDSPLGLTYEGSVDGLDVSIDGENVITAEVIFAPGTNLETTTVEHLVTAGEGAITDENGNRIDESGDGEGSGEEEEDPFERERRGGDGNDRVTLGYADRGAFGGAGGDYIVGNERDNRLDGGIGDDTILGYGGNDTIITGSGNDQVDGGDGIDTVLYEDVVYQDNSQIFLRQAANTVSYNNTDTLTDVEFIQFDDVRISAETLAVTPTMETSEIELMEGSKASFNFELSTPAPVDVMFDYSTADLSGIAGADYVAAFGQIIILAGETTGTVEIEALADEIYDEETENLTLEITGLTGATFSNNETELQTIAYIQNQVEALTLNGSESDDFLVGGNNHDLIQGGEGNDTIDGAEGKDTLRGNGGNDLIQGGEDNDTLVGFAGNDTLDGGNGSDRIYVAVDNDITLTDTQVIGDGTDTISNIEFANLYGRDGDNRINAQGTTNISTTIKGNDGNDNLRGGAKDDIILGGNDNDTLIGFAGNDTINGGNGSDRIYVAVDNEIILTDTQVIGDGTDTISNIEFANLYGRDGDNLITAQGASNIKVTIKGEDGNDTLRGGAQNDTILGGDGDDILVGFAGNDKINGGKGSDRLYVAVDNNITLNDTQVIGDGTDTISQIEFANLYGRDGDNLITAQGASNIKVTIKGEDGNDTLRGGAQNDTILGGNGDDILVGFAGNDVINGGNGSDRLYVAVDNEIILTDTQVIGDGTDTISQIEYANLYGRDGDNLIDATGATNISTTIKGNDGNDTLMGSQMGDLIQGGNAHDLIYGGSGEDTLIGNSGMDIFALESLEGADVIKDFKHGIDSFGLTESLTFGDLSITNNQAQTATLITDTTNNNQLLAVVNNISAADITITDFVDL